MIVRIGALLWCALLVLWILGVVELDVIRFMLMLALLVVVPLGIELHQGGRPGDSAAALGTGAAATLGVLLPAGSTLAAAIGAPALVFAGGLTLRSLGEWWRGGRRPLALAWVVAPAYLIVGVAWLLLNRIGVEPFGIREPFVLLTAVHFHFAGFGATLMAALVLRYLGPRPVVVVAAVLIVVAPPIVAAGFTFLPLLQVVGAVLLTLGLWLLAGVTLVRIVPEAPSPAKWFLAISSLAVFVPMVLAVQWAVGWNFGTPALSISMMARTHGAVNALGFTLSGLLGWATLGERAMSSVSRGEHAGRSPNRETL